MAPTDVLVVKLDHESVWGRARLLDRIRALVPSGQVAVFTPDGAEARALAHLRNAERLADFSQDALDEIRCAIRELGGAR